jgi:hypothetical protein
VRIYDRDAEEEKEKKTGEGSGVWEKRSQE